jgi:pimeloyl-ACP methyl ester carboxylesterase
MKEQLMQKEPIQRTIAGLAWGGAAVMGGLITAAAAGIAYSRLAIDHELPLPAALNAERRELDLSDVGRISTYAGEQSAGQPLVLIHSVNAAASALEMKPLFEVYRQNRPVYALDLPGYGFSDRQARPYTPEFFSNALGDFLDEVVGEPADVIALSLSSEFAARAANRVPEQFRSLTMISPSGFTRRSRGRATEQAGQLGADNSLYGLLANPVWAQALYDLIASRMSLRFYLGKSFVGEIPDELVEYGYATSHQPGAMNVPLYFLSGRLFTQDVLNELYVDLSVPTLILYDQDFYVRFDLLPELVNQNELINTVRIAPTLGLPHWEQPEETKAALDVFWGEIAER